MVLDTLVVVEKVAAAVRDRFAAVDLDRFGMMRGVPKHHVDLGRLDQTVSERAI
jgi:hypothetical protein